MHWCPLVHLLGTASFLGGSWGDDKILLDGHARISQLVAIFIEHLFSLVAPSWVLSLLLLLRRRLPFMLLVHEDERRQEPMNERMNPSRAPGGD